MFYKEVTKLYIGIEVEYKTEFSKIVKVKLGGYDSFLVFFSLVLRVGLNSRGQSFDFNLVAKDSCTRLKCLGIILNDSEAVEVVNFFQSYLLEMFLLKGIFIFIQPIFGRQSNQLKCNLTNTRGIKIFELVTL